MAGVSNWTQWFKEEKDIYIQNISNTIVSMTFQVAPGVTEGFTLQNDRDPINLTDHIPFAAIKASTDFRKLMNRRPPVMIVLTQEEYEGYYARRQGETGKSAEDLRVEAIERQRKLQNRQMELSSKSLAQKPDPRDQQSDAPEGPFITEDDIINPRIMHLMKQVAHDVPKDQKMSATELLQELDNLLPELKIDDLEYVRSKGHYKAVKKWAVQQEELLAGEGVDDEEEDVDETSSTKGPKPVTPTKEEQGASA